MFDPKPEPRDWKAALNLLAKRCPIFDPNGWQCKGKNRHCGREHFFFRKGQDFLILTPDGQKVSDEKALAVAFAAIGEVLKKA